VNKRRIYLGVTALAVFLGALLLRTPAPWILAGANHLLPTGISWSEAQGTLTGMEIRGLGFTLPGERRVWLRAVSLKPALSSLLGGRLTLQFRIDDGGEQLTGTASFGLQRWALTEAQGTLPLAAFLPTLPELEIAGLEGRVSIQAETVSARYGALPDRGQLQVQLENIRAVWLLTDQPLGSYRLALRAQEQTGISGRLNTHTDPALFSLTATVTQPSSSPTLTFQGAGQLSPEAPMPLRRILPILGKASRDRVTIDWQVGLD